jgi:hypothetical protein
LNLFNWNLQANVGASWYGVGRYLRLLEAIGTVTIDVEYASGERQTGQLLAGIGVDLSHPASGEPYKSIQFTSPTAQTLRVLTSEWPTTDSRIAGAVSIKQAGEFQGKPELAIDGAAQTIEANADRQKLYLSAPDTNTGKIWIGASAAGNGIPLEPGDVWFEDFNGQLSLIGAAGDKLHVAELL